MQAPPRGNRTLYCRDVDARVADEFNRLAIARGWTQAQLVAQLIELRRGSLDFIAEHPNEMSRPMVELLERLGLFPVQA
jgi:hypothetical protein